MTSDNAAAAEVPLNDRALQAAVIEGSNIADEYLVRKIVGAYLGALPGAPAEMPGIEEIARALAIFFANNRQPCMSGDPRDRLSPLRRRDLDDAASAVLALFAPFLAEKERAERERCAKVAETAKSYDDNLQRSAGCATTGQRIAAAIRAGE